MIKQLLQLACIGLCCGALLILADRLTQDNIQQNRNKHDLALLYTMLENLEDLPERMATQVNAWLNSKSAEPIGNCANMILGKTTSVGYAGDIGFIYLRRADQSLSFRVFAHRETPGIGDFIDVAKDKWITQLDHQMHNAHTQLDNVSGATITSTAVNKAIQDTVRTMELYCAQ